MKVSELDYELPSGLIAQRPPERRDDSRLLVYERASGEVRHRLFSGLPEELARGELLVANDTRVVPARIPIASPRGEVLLLERRGENGVWEALARPTRRLRAGRRYGPVELLEHLGEGRWLLRVDGEPAGEAPLPPYITEPLADPGRYQTVYADEAGSAAAPTAGLHFTPELLARLDVEYVTLHVGLDTFRPLAVEDLAEHRLHGERYSVRPEAWKRIEAAERVLAVGTTTRPRARVGCARGAARRAHGALRHTRIRVPPRRCAPDELPPAPFDAARARDGVRRPDEIAATLRAGNRRAVPLLLVRGAMLIPCLR